MTKVVFRCICKRVSQQSIFVETVVVMVVVVVSMVALMEVMAEVVGFDL